MTWDTQCGAGTFKKLDKPLRQGDSWNITVVLNEYFSDMAVAGAVRTDYVGQGTLVADMVASSTDKLVWSLFLTPVETSLLTPGGNYVYDLQYSIPSQNIVQTFLGGKVIVLGQVTN